MRKIGIYKKLNPQKDIGFVVADLTTGYNPIGELSLSVGSLMVNSFTQDHSKVFATIYDMMVKKYGEDVDYAVVFSDL